jgi:hypothetical protein
VVTANVPEGTIVAGNPARIIGYRSPESYRRVPVIENRGEAVVVTKPARERCSKPSTNCSPR